MSARLRNLFACSAGLALATGGCAGKPPAANPVPWRGNVRGVPLAPNVTCYDATCRSYTVVPFVRTRTRYGIGCLGNVPPGERIPFESPPLSYAAADAGKPGVPALSLAEASVLARFEERGASKALRFAHMRAATTPDNFIVFDATDGPCEVWAGGYSVLNGGCNEFYQPGENPYRTHAGPGCYPTPAAS